MPVVEVVLVVVAVTVLVLELVSGFPHESFLVSSFHWHCDFLDYQLEQLEFVAAVAAVSLSQ